MISRPSTVLEIVWIVWLASWVAASFWSGRTQRRVSASETWTYRLGMIVGGILLFPWTATLLAEKPLWEISFEAAYILTSVMLMGLAFTWAARIHLGLLWSSAITRKQNHQIVNDGPYGVVRHPIYTGIIVALLATAAAEARSTALLGVAFIIYGFFLKARSEERFLRGELGYEAYDAYCHQVPMLIPFLPRR